MKGKILDFSVTQGGGLILGSDGTRYLFNADQWHGQSLPKVGQDVDFNINDVKKAIEIYPDVFAVTQEFISTSQTNYPSRSYDNYQNLDQNSFWDYTVAAYTKNFANFQGRARRREFWGVSLVVALITSPVSLTFIWIMNGGSNVDPLFGQFIILLYLLICLVNLIPSSALAVRRLHDIGKSGWWYWISLVPIIGGIWILILLCTEGTRGDNRFGADPKAVERV